jgi:hypothetical protein
LRFDLRVGYVFYGCRAGWKAPGCDYTGEKNGELNFRRCRGRGILPVEPLPDKTSRNVATCNKVLEWMDGHEGELPRLLTRGIGEEPLAERSLRSRFNYLKTKSSKPPEVCALIDQIGYRSLSKTGVKVCLAVLAWMDAHENVRPYERKNYVEDAMRAECILARSFRKLKSKKEHSSTIISLIEKIGNRAPRRRLRGKQTCASAESKRHRRGMANRIRSIFDDYSDGCP